MPEYIGPYAFILLRVSVTVILFWFSWFLGTKFQTRIEKKDYRRLILCGVFGVALNQLTFFKGLSMTTPINASLVMLTTPILVGILATITLKEKLSSRKIIGLLLGVSGAALLISMGTATQFAPDPLLGNCFIFINATSYAIYLILIKPIMEKYPPVIVIRWVFFFGAIMVFPFGLPGLLETDFASFQTKQWTVVLYVILGMTFLTYLWNIFALKILSPTVVGTYIYMQPFLAAIIAIIFYKEGLEWYKILAGLLIFSGVFLVSYQKRITTISSRQP